LAPPTMLRALGSAHQTQQVCKEQMHFHGG
jgi:hypothetical protein